MDVSNWTRWDLEYPQQFEAYSFENIDIQWWYQFSETYWSLPFYVTIIYYIGLFICYKYMEHRPPMDLRKELFWWNFSIGAFSIMALYRMSPELFRVLSQSNGFHRSVCVREGLNRPVVFWIFAYAWSKAAHFGDTFFIVLRKKPIQFFHVYHHTVACLVPMQLIHLGEPIGRWFTWLNYLVHAIIYNYFAMKSMQLKIPKAASSIVVIMELFQMLAGLGMGLYSMHVLNNGGDCIRHSQSIQLINAVYTSFVILAGKMCYEYFFANQIKQNSKLKEL